MSGATLAACTRQRGAPAPVGIALHIACEIASALHAAHARVDAAAGRPHVHGHVGPETILVRYDGGIELLPPSGAAPAEAVRAARGYLAPEQVSASDVDRRADVFALGVVLWEMLASTRLFERGSEEATRAAIVTDPIRDIREANPAIPAVVGEVLRASLERDRDRRFDTAEAFGQALVRARASSGIAGTTRADVARWVGDRVPSQASPASASPAIPDLDLGEVGGIPALAPSTRKAPAKAAASSPDASTSTAFDSGTFDMEIERNVAGAPQANAPSPSRSGAGPRIPAAHGATAIGLELAVPSRVVREGAALRRDDSEPSVVLKVAGALVTLAIAGGTTYALLQKVHGAGGLDVTRALPHAFDGSSVTESGAVSLIALVVAVGLGFVGLRLKPHAWAIMASGGVLLLLTLAMVTVTLSSTGESPTPPDGVLLVPYLFPAATLLLALGLYLRSARLLTRGRAARRAGALPLAAIAGLLAFLAFETSRFAR